MGTISKLFKFIVHYIGILNEFNTFLISKLFKFIVHLGIENADNRKNLFQNFSSL